MWRSAPLLPWRVQCPVRVCAALVAGSGSSGRYLVLCLSRFPLPAPRVPRCVWRAVLSWCPLPSLAGTPFHAVCAFRELGPVSQSGNPRVPFACLCACAPAASASPPPWVVWRAHLARSRHWALVGPFHVVRAPPHVLPWSLAPSGVLGGGRSGPGSPLPGLGLWGWRKGVPVGGAFHCCEGRLRSGAPPPPTARPLGGLLGSATHVLWARACGCGGPTLSPCPARPVGAACRGGGGGPSPYLAWGCAPPVGRVSGVRVPGGGPGGRGSARAPCPPFVRPGGPVGRGVALPRSVPLPSLGRQQSGCHWPLSGHGGRGPHTAPVCARPPSLGAICAASWRVGTGSLVPRGSCGSQRLGRGGSSLGQGEGGPSPLPRGSGGRRPRGLRVRGGGGGGVAPQPPCSPSGGRPAVPYPGPPLVVGAHPPGVRLRSGSRGRPGGGGGGMRGGPWTALLGAPSDLNPPSALPEWAMVMGGAMEGARPPYCSVAPPCAAPRLGPCAAPLRWCGLARRPRPPREQAAGGAEARGVQVQPHPPPPAWRSLLGEGGRPLGSGGAQSRSCGPQSWGGSRGGGWGGRSAAPRSPAPLGVGLPSVVSGAPPWGTLVPWGLPGGRGRRARPGRPPMGQFGGGGREGGGTPPPWLAPPPSPGRPLKGPLRLRRLWRRRPAVGRQRAGRERAGGSSGALAAGAVPPHPGCSGLFGGGAGPPSLRSASVRFWT